MARPFGAVRALAVAAFLITACLVSATPASAHSQLERTNPAEGAQLDTLPGQITLTFNQNVLGLGSVIEVTGPGGNVAAGPPTVVDHEVREAIAPGSAAGEYTVIWRVTSADGHPISGQFAFTAATGSSGTASAQQGSTAAQPGSTTAQVSSSATSSESGGGGSVLIWLLVAVAALVAAGVVIATRRSPAQAPED
jgi:methionine-rich copper-binding protein CopC